MKHFLVPTITIKVSYCQMILQKLFSICLIANIAIQCYESQIRNKYLNTKYLKCGLRFQIVGPFGRNNDPLV